MASTVAEIEQILILLIWEKNKILLTIKILNKKSPLNKSLVEKLKKKRDDNLNIKDISIYMTYLLLDYYNVKMNYTFEKNLFKIDLTLI